MVSVPARPALVEERLRNDLRALGLPFRNVEVVAETGSTNGELIARAAAGDEVDGVVLIAEHQTAGRGRHGRKWSAPRRSQIAMSIGVSAHGVPAEGWGWLPLAIGVAVVEAVATETPVQPGLKWPNDVMAGDGKLAGILAEMAVPSSVIVVGIGLNATLTPAEAPDPVATSLMQLGVDDVDRHALTCAILRETAGRIAAWREFGGAEPGLVDAYLRHCLTVGARVRASLPGNRAIVGLARGVDEAGRLCIETDGEVAAVSAGDVVHLRTP